jgi:Pyruvate/2-oxoacid:ferredoxin oxidoreductase delta subunit
MLDRTLYIDRVGAFALDRLSCLRNEYAKNECTLCQEACAHEAFVFEQGKLRLSSVCVGCGACMGSCPAKALHLYGFGLEKIQQILSKEGEVVLTCKEGMPCLGALSVDEWSALLLEGKSFSCELSSCDACEHNKDGRMRQRIEDQILEANALAQALGLSQRIASTEQKQANSLGRRAFFERFLAPVNLSVPMPPAPLQHLKQALKRQSVQEHTLPRSFSFLHQKQIDTRCDNCQECVQFCPTKALSYNNDQTKILFQVGKCIGCGICEDICHHKAIAPSERGVDIVEVAFDKARVLIEHDLQVCTTCKCAFSYKGGEKVCERCASFEKEHAEMFMMASQSR